MEYLHSHSFKKDNNFLRHYYARLISSHSQKGSNVHTKKQPITKDERKTTKRTGIPTRKACNILRLFSERKKKRKKSEMISDNLGDEGGSLRHLDATETYDYQRNKVREG